MIPRLSGPKAAVNVDEGTVPSLKLNVQRFLHMSRGRTVVLTVDEVLKTHRHRLFVGYRHHLACLVQLNVNLLKLVFC